MEKRLTEKHPLLSLLNDLGIVFYAGVTGGGVIHFLKYISQYSEDKVNEPSFLTIGEYVAGFIPLGYFLASRKVACGVATTGAATKLLACGMSDAKLHNIPSIYVVPETDIEYTFPGALQDTSVFGSNMVHQIMAEFPDSTFVLNEFFSFQNHAQQIYEFLKQSRPIIFILSKHTTRLQYENVLKLKEPENSDHNNRELLQEVRSFVSVFRSAIHHRRLIIMVGEELFHCADAKVLTTLLSEGLQAETIWSMNGANSVSRKNKYGFGHIGFGGNDLAMDIFQSINENDCVLLLGICPDEYTTNFKQLTAAEVFYVGQAGEVYGLVDHKMTYFIKGNFHAIQGDLSLILNEMVSDIQKGGYTHILASEAPQNLNKENFQAAREGYVDMADFYLQLDELWAENSIAFLDVCLAYKDHQYVIPRPNDHIDFISLYRGSAMGGAFGLAVGAKIGAPEKNVFCFTGDGCFRLFAGTMAEVSDLGIVVFLLNNQTLGIVSQGLRKILPDVIEEGYHSVVKEVDYCGIARSFGWKSFKLNPDLKNLSTIFEEIKPDMKQSVFIELEVDPEQQLGKNPRLANL